MEFFFLIHIICNSVLVGILFVTQLITYPSFLAVVSHVFISFHKRYTMNISFIVIPFMIGELFSLIYLNYIDSDLFLSLMILLVIWLFTFIILVPIHNKLSLKHNISLINRLINYNWLRTILWAVKLIILFYFFYDKVIT